MSKRRAALALLLGLPVTACTKEPPKPPLPAEHAAVWEEAKVRHLSNGMEQLSSEDANAIAKIGDPIVPHIEAILGQAARGSRGGKPDFWLIVALARHGSPAAMTSLRKVLIHEHEGRVYQDRETAAKALLWLGATEAAGDLKKAIEDTRARIRRETGKEPGNSGDPFLDRVLKNLEQTLADLEKGPARRDMTDFPFED